MPKLTPQQQQKRAQLKGRWGARFIRLMGKLPLPVNSMLGSVLGWLAVVFATDLGKMCLANVQRCLPNLSTAQQRQLARCSIIETAKTAAETAFVWMQPYQKLQRYIVKQSNLSLLEQEFRCGNGVLLLLPHIGNWEIMGSFIPQLFPYTAMYQPPESEAMDLVMRRGRSREGTRLVPATRQGVADALKVLKAGEILTVLPDQVPNEGAGEWSEFFSQPALTMTLVYKLIQRTQCRVLLAAGWRCGGGFHIEFMQPLEGIYSEDGETSLLAMNKSIEACVLKQPQQYQWEYNRFKRKRRRQK